MGNFRFNPFTKKLDLAEINTPSAGSVDFLTGNSGGAVAPDGGGNINIIGSGTISVAGNAGTHTLTISSTGPTYAEGTWMPTFYGGTAAGTPTYTTQSGFYRRIGNVVFCEFKLVVSFALLDLTGTLNLGGLPFAISNALAIDPSVAISGNNIGFAGTLSNQGIYLKLLHNTTTAQFAYEGGTGADSTYALTLMDENFIPFNAPADITVVSSFFYFV